MNVRRIIGSMTAAALVATTVTVAATTAPASAATVVPTKVVMQISHKKAEYRDKISVTGNVQGQNADGTYGTLPYGSGSVTLQFLPTGGRTWQTLQSDDQGYSFYFYPVGVKTKGSYRVVYNGGTYNDYQFTPSSASKALKVERKLTVKTMSGKRAGFKGKISPANKLKITVFKKKGKKFKKFRSLRTNKRGGWVIGLPAPRNGRFTWKVVFKGDRKFVASSFKGTTYKY